MPKPKMSKSGLFEIRHTNLAKSKFDSTEIEIRIPKFQNFGLGLAERERQADEYEKQLEAEMSPEEIAAAEAEADQLVADMTKSMREAAAESKKELANTPDGKKKEAMELLAKMMQDAVAMMESDPDDAEERDEDDKPDERTSNPEDFEIFSVMPDDGTPWNAKAENRIDDFIRTWPEVRSQVLKKAHTYYKKLYPELKDIFGDMPSFKFTMPEPTSPEAIEDLFSINVIYLRDDGTIGISGSCTWDDEHGFGAVIKRGKVVTFGHASDGFC